MTATPAHQLPTIREGTTLGFRFTMGQWCGIIGACGGGLIALAGFIIWLHTIYREQQDMKATMVDERAARVRQDEKLDRVLESVREIEFRQKYGITSSLPASVKANP